MNRRSKFFFASMIFLVCGGLSMVLILGLAMTFFPPQRRFVLGASTQQSGGSGFWDRLRQVWRSRRGRGRLRRRTRAKVLGTGYGRRGVVSTVSSNEHLALREALVGNFFLHNFYSKSPEKAWNNARNARGSGPWRSYELNRLRTRILGMRFDETKDWQLLADYKATALKTVNSPYTNFEDFFWTGHACLFAKDDRAALKYLQQAELRWPAKDTFYGWVYFYLLCTHAVQGNGREVLARLDRFKANYPDWLYIETYIEELDALARQYPQAPLLEVVRGRLLTLVLNDAAALVVLKKALRTGRIEAFTAAKVRSWVRDLETSL